MAYLRSPEEEEQQVQPGTEAAGGGGSSAGGASGQPAPAAAGTGSGFVSFDRYLAANQGKAQEMAGAVATKVKDKAQGLRTGVESAEARAKNAITQATPGATAQQKTVAGLQANPQAAMASTMGGKGLAGPAAAPGPKTFGVEATGNAPKPVSTNAERDAQVAALDAVAKQQYSGPAGLDAGTEEGLRKQATDVGAAFSAADTEAGRAALLQQELGPGATGFDAMLAGGAVGQQVGAQRDAFADLKGLVDGASKRTADAANAARTGTEAQAASAADEREKLRGKDFTPPKPAAGAAPVAPGAKPNGGKAQSYAEYDAENTDPLHTVHRAAEGLDPVTSIIEATGNRNPAAGVAAQMFGKYLGHDGETNNANRLYMDRVMPPGTDTPENRKQIYDSLTPDELHSLERMPVAQQQQAIDKLAERLGIKRRMAGYAPTSGYGPPPKATNKAIVGANASQKNDRAGKG